MERLMYNTILDGMLVFNPLNYNIGLLLTQFTTSEFCLERNELIQYTKCYCLDVQ